MRLLDLRPRRRELLDLLRLRASRLRLWHLRARGLLDLGTGRL